MKTALKHKAIKTTKKPANMTTPVSGRTSRAASGRRPARGRQSAPGRLRAFAAVDALLDEALVETFPASDPVALTQPSRRRRAALKKRAGRRL
jgi:hypothetical protein